MPRYGGMTPYPLRYGGKGSGPRLERVLESLNAARGTAYDVTSTSTVYAENFAIARAIDAAWGTNNRLAKAFDPARLTEPMLSRWERIMGLFPEPGTPAPRRRAAVVAQWQRWGTPFDNGALVSKVTDLLGSTLVEVEYDDASSATTYWSGGRRVSAENLCDYPELFKASAWGTFGGTMYPEAGTYVPEGPLAPGCPFLEDGTTGLHCMAGGTVAMPTGGWGPSFTVSAYVYPIARPKFALLPRFGAAFADGADIIIDLTTDTILSTSTAGAGTLARAKCTSVGGGWHRVVATVGGLSQTFTCLFAAYDSGSSSYVYAGTNNLEPFQIDGVKCENAPCETPYVPKWMSTIKRIRFKVTQPAGMTDGEFYETVNAANTWLDGEAPADMTWSWWRVDATTGTQGFYLDSPHNLDNDALAH